MKYKVLNRNIILLATKIILVFLNNNEKHVYQQGFALNLQLLRCTSLYINFISKNTEETINS